VIFVAGGGCHPRNPDESPVHVDQSIGALHHPDIRMRSIHWVPRVEVAGSVAQSCTGIAINQNKILTAAHCLWSYKAQHFAKPTDIRATFTVGSQKLVYPVAYFSVHPLYVPGPPNVVSGSFDLAVLTVAGPLDQRIFLLRPSFVTDTVPLKQFLRKKSFTFMGYGTQGVLGVGADIPIPLQICLLDPRKTLKTSCNQPAVHMFCASPEPHEPRVTSGDSGGPAFVFEKGVPMVIGMTIAYNAHFSFFETFDRPENKQWLESQWSM